MSIDSAKDFFVEKHKWSVIKDSLLEWYLTPYISKILMATNNFYLIDGFAGPGYFEDGQKGSPLIEADLLLNCFKRTNNKRIKINLVCVEKDKKLFERLVKNTQGINFSKCYNDTIENILPAVLASAEKNAAVFLYLDPFGIKDLPANLESILSKRKDIKFEMLLNFNSFGCYRECKRLVGDKEFDDYFENNKYLIDIKSTPKRMDDFLGTDKWRESINNKNPEYLLSVLLCEKLKKAFKYTLNMPIKNIKNGVLKYRMIHCTNSANGAILMADNMFLQMSEHNMSLFDTDLEGNIIDVNKEVPKLMDFIPGFTDVPVRLNELLITFYENIGVICPTKDLKAFLRKEEMEGNIRVSRNPSVTSTGKKTTFWSEDNGQVIRIVKKMVLDI